MKHKDEQSEARQSKPSVKDKAQNRLTEDGPNLIVGKKANAFLRFLNSKQI